MRGPPPPTLFPYTTLFRSHRQDRRSGQEDLHARARPAVWPRARSARQAVEQRALRHRSEEHTSELQSLTNLVCRLLLEKKTLRAAESLNYHTLDRKCTPLT